MRQKPSTLLRFSATNSSDSENTSTPILVMSSRTETSATTLPNVPPFDAQVGKTVDFKPPSKPGDSVQGHVPFTKAAMTLPEVAGQPPVVPSKSYFDRIQAHLDVVNEM